MASLKGNIILNYINAITGQIFPMIVFSYAACVLLQIMVAKESV